MLKKAFTLVELLVVVGILTVLLGLLIPAIGSARRSSASTTCLANLRQIGTAFTSYITDSDGYLPPAGVNEDGDVPIPVNGVAHPPIDLWPFILMARDFLPTHNADATPPESTLSSIFICPADDVAAAGLSNGSSTDFRDASRFGSRLVRGSTPSTADPTLNWFIELSYGVNGSRGNRDPNLTFPVASQIALLHSRPRTGIFTMSLPIAPRRISEIRQPADMVLLFDGYGIDTWGNEATNIDPKIRDAGNRIVGRHGKPIAGDKLSGKVNMLLLDGHVAQYDRAEVSWRTDRTSPVRWNPNLP
jgi:prepilin-type N-terminal cleavage/methylation domain-containing protein/prepilin-type processing-associated H-X9-DG protein